MRMKCTRIIGMMICMIQWIPMTGIEEEEDTCTVKPVLSGHSKIDKTKVLKTTGSLMKVTKYCRMLSWNILQYFWPALSDKRSWKPIFGLLFERPLKAGFTAYPIMRMKCTLIIGMMMCVIQWIPMTGIEDLTGIPNCPYKWTSVWESLTVACEQQMFNHCKV